MNAVNDDRVDMTGGGAVWGCGCGNEFLIAVIPHPLPAGECINDVGMWGMQKITCAVV